MIKIVKFAPRDKNTLKGFLTVEMSKIGLELRDLTLHQKNGHHWISFPSREWTDEQGEKKWTPYIKFTDKEMLERFQKAVIYELRKEGKIN